MNLKELSFWYWFFKGSGGKPGYRRLLNIWILFHIIVGVFVSFVVEIDLQTAANAVLLPLAGILIGLSFAWAGNAQALMQTKEIDVLAEHHEGGFVEYVFVYQTAILSILTTLIFWGFAGLGIYDKTFQKECYPNIYFSIETLLFTLSSLTIRECWHVVMGAHWMLLIQKEIKKKANKNNLDK